MSNGQALELAVALAMIAAGIWQYRKRSREGARYGSQSGVFLMLVGALIAIHALGLFDYRPSQGEIDRARAGERIAP